MRSIEAVLNDIDEFTPINDEWEDLDELIDEACSLSDHRVIKCLLRVLERNPEHDGNGVFWSIVHSLEGIGNYEKELELSVLNKPHEMSVLMLNRMLNGGIYKIDGRSIIDILEEISVNNSFAKVIKEDAERYLVRHRDAMQGI